MPELPETETIARDLDAVLRGVHLGRPDIRRPDVLRGERQTDRFSLRTASQRISRVWRRAKMVVLDLSSGDRLVVQPRFTGALVLVAAEAAAPTGRPTGLGGTQHDAVGTLADPFLCIVWPLAEGRALAYRDVRRLGTVSLLDPEAWRTCDAGLGPEPVGPDFTPDALSAILRASRQPVKTVLMDQRRLAGVGNIYATEALWRARVDPSREAQRVARDAAAVSRLHDAVRAVLAESIALRGTTFRDYRDAYGGTGGFAARLQAYGRAGAPCARCGRRLVGTHAIDGRMTVFCPTCQA